MNKLDTVTYICIASIIAAFVGLFFWVNALDNYDIAFKFYEGMK